MKKLHEFITGTEAFDSEPSKNGWLLVFLDSSSHHSRHHNINLLVNNIHGFLTLAVT